MRRFAFAAQQARLLPTFASRFASTKDALKRKRDKKIKAAVPSPAATPITSAEQLDRFVKEFDRLIPKDDVPARLKVALLEQRNYLHIADPMDDGTNGGPDPNMTKEEIEELDGLRESVAHVAQQVGLSEAELIEIFDRLESGAADDALDILFNGGANLSETADEDLIPIVEADPPGANSSTAMKAKGSETVSDIFESLGLDENDPDLQPMKSAILADQEHLEVAVSAMQSQKPRLFVNFLQGASFIDKQTSVVKPTTKKPKKPSSNVMADLHQYHADVRDPFGIEHLEMDFYDETRSPLMSDAVICGERDDGFRPKRTDPNRNVTKKEAETTVAETKKIMKTVSHSIGRTAVKQREKKSTLRVRTGVSMVAIGVSLSNKDQLTNVVILQDGRRIAPMKRKANDLYAPLLYSTFPEFQQSTSHPL